MKVQFKFFQEILEKGCYRITILFDAILQLLIELIIERKIYNSQMEILFDYKKRSFYVK